LKTRNSKASDIHELSDGISASLLKLKLVYFDRNTQKNQSKKSGPENLGLDLSSVSM